MVKKFKCTERKVMSKIYTGNWAKKVTKKQR